MKWILLAACLIFSAGCAALYNSVDHRLFPAPVIQNEAEAAVKWQGDQLIFAFFARVQNTEIVMLRYLCESEGKWIQDTTTVYHVYPIGGEVTHFHPTDCYSYMGIDMRAFNNFRKRSEKIAVLKWKVSMERLIALEAAKGVQ